jgi:hypothetical protein
MNEFISNLDETEKKELGTYLKESSFVDCDNIIITALTKLVTKYFRAHRETFSLSYYKLHEIAAKIYSGEFKTWTQIIKDL